MITSMTCRQMTKLSGVSTTTAWRFKNNIHKNDYQKNNILNSLTECNRKKHSDFYLDLIIDIYKLSNLNVDIKNLIEKRMNLLNTKEVCNVGL